MLQWTVKYCLLKKNIKLDSFSVLRQGRSGGEMGGRVVCQKAVKLPFACFSSGSFGSNLIQTSCAQVKQHLLKQYTNNSDATLLTIFT